MSDLGASGSVFARALANAKVVVVGLGRSGVAAAKLARKLGATVTGVDALPAERLASTGLAEAGVTLFAGIEPARANAPDVGTQELVACFAEADLIVVSPGVPHFEALDREARRGAVVIGEIELATRLLDTIPSVAITGSNGKSTTTTLVGELFAEAGMVPFVGGNLGDPPAEIVPGPGEAAPSARVLVLEISSFQAERIPRYAPRVAALLNVSPNHLDRYAGFEAYVAAKGNLFVNQSPADTAVVPVGDALCLAEARRGKGTVVTFGRLEDGADVGFDREVVRDTRSGLTIPRREIRVTGEHNMQNVTAALALVAPFGIEEAVLRKVLGEFRGLAHRIELVREVAGVRFYDDSKGTNVGATVAAILGLEEERVVLIAGGRDKLGSYEPLVEALAKKGRAAILIGEAADRLAASIGDVVPIERADGMDEAVDRAHALAHAGDAVLLSPACSSFDMFRDYKHRAEVFVEAVVRITSSGTRERERRSRNEE